MKYYKEFAITGVINLETKDADGLTSTKEEKRKLLGVIINLSTHVGNVVTGHLEREKVLGIYDYSLDTREAAGAANAYKSTVKTQYIEVGQEIPEGETFKMGILCGGVANNISGSYVYEVI
jgi:hypothetical protein